MIDSGNVCIWAAVQGYCACQVTNKVMTGIHMGGGGGGGGETGASLPFEYSHSCPVEMWCSYSFSPTMWCEKSAHQFTQLQMGTKRFF